MKLTPKTFVSLLLLYALGCASVTVDPEGDGNGDGDGDSSTGGVVLGNTGGIVVIGDGDGDGDNTGGVLIGDGDGDGDGDVATGGGSSTGGGAATGGNSSSCTGCKAWSEFGYHTPPPPTPGACVAALNGNDYIFESGQYNTACGPPGEAEAWCSSADGVFTLCD